jgi:hypothetical protein
MTLPGDPLTDMLQIHNEAGFKRARKERAGLTGIFQSYFEDTDLVFTKEQTWESMECAGRIPRLGPDLVQGTGIEQAPSRFWPSDSQM